MTQWVILGIPVGHNRFTEVSKSTITITRSVKEVFRIDLTLAIFYNACTTHFFFFPKLFCIHSVLLYTVKYVFGKISFIFQYVPIYTRYFVFENCSSDLKFANSQVLFGQFNFVKNIHNNYE